LPVGAPRFRAMRAYERKIGHAEDASNNQQEDA
jgi:hypothetical protein